MPKNDLRATLVVPVYNEYPAINDIMEPLLNLPFMADLEVIVVDDGSDDGTGEALAKLHKRRGDFILLHHEHNQGYGASLKTGVLNASMDIIVITDADGSYPNEIIPELIDAYIERNLKMVVGARLGPDAAISFIRRPPKWVLNKIASTLVGFKIPDLNSGLRVFDREIALNNLSLLSDRFSFTTTITLVMLTQNHKTEYIPIKYHKRLGKSKIHPLQDPINFLIIIVTTVLYFRPLKVLFPLGLVFLLPGIATTIYQGLVLRNITTAAMLLISIGLNVLVLALVSDLIVKSRPKIHYDRVGQKRKCHEKSSVS